jgi:hypothetical protein
MSTRAIAAVTGVEQKTAANDIVELRKSSSVELPPTLGRDGKTRKAPERRPDRRGRQMPDTFVEPGGKLRRSAWVMEKEIRERAEQGTAAIRSPPTWVIEAGTVRLGAKHLQIEFPADWLIGGG